jgi:hypothetical protein
MREMIKRADEPRKGKSAVSVPEARPDSPKCRACRYSVLGAVAAAVVLGVLLSCFARWYWAATGFIEKERQIKATVESLAKRRPHAMTRGQWGCAVAWTVNLVGNSGLQNESKLDDLSRFQRELDQRTKGEVDMATILWIWDQHAKLTRAGKEYQRFRRQMLAEIESVGENDDPWAMNVP